MSGILDDVEPFELIGVYVDDVAGGPAAAFLVRWGEAPSRRDYAVHDDAVAGRTLIDHPKGERATGNQFELVGDDHLLRARVGFESCVDKEARTWGR